MLTNPLAVPLVHAVGGELEARVEDHPNPDYIDHVWITMDTGTGDRPLIAINTLSKLNRSAGFDSRVRVGLVRETWAHLPPRGIEEARRFDYREIEDGTNVFYEHHVRERLEELLFDLTNRAILLEVWGAPYLNRRRLGLHQIHSRGASCAVANHVEGRDGALRFYYEHEQTSDLVLFKFCGQT